MSINLQMAREILAAKEKEPRQGYGNGGGDIRWWRLPDTGTPSFRILPPWEGSGLPAKVSWTHWNIPSNDAGITKIASVKEYGVEDPIETVLQKWRNKVNTEEFEATAKTWMNVLPLNDEKCDAATPHLLGVNGNFTYFWLLEQLTDPDIGDITDPHRGSNVTFKRKLKTIKWERTIARGATRIAETDEQIQDVLGKMYNLDKVFRAPDDEYLKKCRIAAQAIDKELERRFLSPAGGGKGGAGAAPKSGPLKVVEMENDRPTGLSEKKTLQDVVKPAPTLSVPKGAPECFGKANMFYCGLPESERDDYDMVSNPKGIDLKQYKDCTKCPYEFKCLKVIEASEVSL